MAGETLDIGLVASDTSLNDQLERADRLMRGLRPTAKTTSDQMDSAAVKTASRFVVVGDKIRAMGARMREAARSVGRGAQAIFRNLTNIQSGIALVGRGLTALATPLNMAVEQSSGLVRMEFAFESLGLEVESSTQTLEDFADEMQATTQFGDNQTRQMAQQFASLAGSAVDSIDDIIQGVGLIQDISVLTGKSATRITRSLAQAFGGETEALRSLLPGQAELIDQLNEIDDAGERADATIAALETTFGDGRFAIDETAQAMARVGNEWGDTLEAMGDAISTALIDSGVFDTIIDSLDEWQAWISDNGDTITSFFESVFDAAVSVAHGIGAIVSSLRDMIQNLPGMEAFVASQERFAEAMERVEQANRRADTSAPVPDSLIPPPPDSLIRPPADFNPLSAGATDPTDTDPATDPAATRRAREALRAEQEIQEQRVQMAAEFQQSFIDQQVSQREYLIELAQKEIEIQQMVRDEEQAVLDERIAAKVSFAAERAAITDASDAADLASQRAIFGGVTDGLRLTQQATGLLIKNKGREATVLGLIEVGRAAAAFFNPAEGGPAGAVSHGIAAAKYFAAAAAAGQGGGRGASTRGGGGAAARTGPPRRAPRAPSDARQNAALSGITINMNTLVADRKSGRRVSQALNRHAEMNTGDQFNPALTPGGS